MVVKEVADRMLALRDRRRIAERKKNTRNLLLGATIGTAAGAAAGLLFAPQSGRKTRDQIYQRTGETINTIKESVAETGDRIADRVQEKASRLRAAAETCATSVKAAASESEEDKKNTKTAKKK